MYYHNYDIEVTLQKENADITSHSFCVFENVTRHFGFINVE
jgi:hypothetical protein